MALVLIGIYLFGLGYSLQLFLRVYEGDKSLQEHPSRFKFLAMLSFAAVWPIFWASVFWPRGDK